MLEVLKKIEKNTHAAQFNIGSTFIAALTTSLSFILSLALNDGFSKLFSRVIPTPGAETYSWEDVGGAWIYAAVMLVSSC